MVGMTKQRYYQLAQSLTLNLTAEEFDAGWHFCPDWDGMLIHKTDGEMDGCTCTGLRNYWRSKE